MLENAYMLCLMSRDREWDGDVGVGSRRGAL